MANKQINKKALIIGASSGIGAALAIELAKNNITVGITGRRAQQLLEVKKQYPNNIFIKAFDCTEVNNIELTENFINELGGVDLFIFNAGINNDNPNLDFSIEKDTINIHISAFTKLINWAYLYFEKEKQGHIIAISSIAAVKGNELAPAYNATKAYQTNYLQALNQKSFTAKNNVIISDIRPGFVNTVMAKGEKQLMMISKEEAAKQIYKAIIKQKEVAYIPSTWRFIVFIIKMLPEFLLKRI